MSWKTKITSSILFAAAITAQIGANVYADNATILKKWTLSEYYNCIVEGKETSSLKTQNSGKVVDDIMSSDESTTKNRLMPSFGFQGSQETLSCRDLLFNSLDYGNPDAKNVKWNGTPGEAQDLLENTFFYTPLEDASEENTPMGGEFQIFATKNVYEDGELISTGEVKSVKITAELDSSDNKLVYKHNGIQWFNAIKISFNDHKLEVTVGDFSTSVPLSNDFETTYNNVKDALKDKGGMIVSATTENQGYEIKTYYTFNVDNLIAAGKNYSEYIIEDSADTASKTLQKLNDKRNYANFTKEEIYDLYYYYLNKSVPDSGQNYRIYCGTVPEDSKAGLTDIKLVGKDNTVQQCYINLNGKSIDEIPVNIIKVNGRYPSFKTGTMKEVIEWFANNLTVGETLNSVNTTGDTGNQPTESDVEQQSDPCFSKSGAMGWILCPAISMIQDVGAVLYPKIKEHLRIDGTLYATVDEKGENSSVYKAWRTMQGVSNTVFIIVILVIVISQVTGVGIDNYGIKKMLPRIITAAILSNLSFLIFQLILDVSNIFGNSLETWLGGLIPLKEGTFGEGANTITLLGSTVVEAIILPSSFFLLQFLTFGTFTGAAVGVALMAITLLIVVVVAIAAFYITLIVRKALAIMVIVIAPVTIALYILPNTEKWFKQWLKITGALILLYPICGLVMGGGSLAGNLLANAGLSKPSEPNTGMVLAGMIAQVAPYFFIPTLLTNSMKGVGNIGAKIQGAGRRIGHRLGNSTSRAIGTGIRASNRYQAAEKRQKDWLAKRRGNRIRARLGADAEGFDPAKLSNRQRYLLSTATQNRNSAIDSSTASFNTVAKDEESEKVKAGNARFVTEQERDAYKKHLGELDLSKNDVARQNAKNAAARRVLNESVQNMVPTVPPDFDTIKATVEQQQREKQSKDLQDAMVTSSGIDIILGKSKKPVHVQADNVKGMQEALEQIIENGDDSNLPAMLAIMNTLKSKGKPGMNALAQVVQRDELVNDKPTGKKISSFNKDTNQLLQQQFMHNISSDKSVKAEDLDLYQHVLNVQSGRKRDLGDFKRGDTTYKLKSEYVPHMTEDAFDATFSTGRVLEGDTIDKYALQTAYEALSNQTISDGLQARQREKLMTLLNTAGIKYQEGQSKYNVLAQIDQLKKSVKVTVGKTSGAAAETAQPVAEPVQSTAETAQPVTQSATQTTTTPKQVKVVVKPTNPFDGLDIDTAFDQFSNMKVGGALDQVIKDATNGTTSNTDGTLNIDRSKKSSN